MIVKDVGETCGAFKPLMCMSHVRTRIGWNLEHTIRRSVLTSRPLSWTIDEPVETYKPIPYTKYTYRTVSSFLSIFACQNVNDATIYLLLSEVVPRFFLVMRING